MSTWTHAAGIIRVDGLGFIQGVGTAGEKRELEKYIGKAAQFDSPERDFENCKLPMGSEGSLQYEVSITGGDTSLSRGHIAIWGDLRDCDSPDELIEWFKVLVSDMPTPFFIRDAVLTVHTEGQTCRLCYYPATYNDESIQVIDTPEVSHE